MHQIQNFLQNLDEVLDWARETIALEARAISALTEQISEDFYACVNAVLQTDGRVVITGIGKSAAIANKIVATLNSTGTPSIFMHAADAVHGDLGMIQNNDVVICISKSGNTPEIKALVPLIKAGGNLLIGMVGNNDSFLATHADHILDVTVDKEACPNNLAPTTSTTAQLVMGDALAVCLLNARGFTSKDFARYHPGGSLGKRLYTTVSDLAKLNAQPGVPPQSAIKEVIVELTSKRLGAVAVLDEGKVVGVITDGDIRRMLENTTDIENCTAADIMGKRPVCLDGDELATVAAQKMNEHKISQIIVLQDGAYSGMVHIHDLNREGILI